MGVQTAGYHVFKYKVQGTNFNSLPRSCEDAMERMLFSLKNGRRRTYVRFLYVTFIE